MSDRYNFSLTTFSPSGKLVQIEYALNAVQQGATCIGIKADNGVVLVSEKRSASPLIDDSTINRLAKLCDRVGLGYAGMGPDARLLTSKARKVASSYHRTYGQDPPVHQLVKEVASTIQEYTQSGGVRPFGVSLLLAGLDGNGKSCSLYQVDPSGAFWPWRAAAIGKGQTQARSFLEKRVQEQPADREDAIHTALLALKETFEGEMHEYNVEIGLVDPVQGFRLLSPSEIRDHLANIH